MIQFFATMQVLSAHALGYLDDQADIVRRARHDRGSITIEQVLWAGAIIGIATLLIGIIRGYVKTKSDEIK